MEEFNSTNSYYIHICDDFLENGFSKIFSLLLSIILSCIFLPLLYGIIWYERFGTDLKRTLINQLFVSVCWYLMIIIIVLQFPMILRFSIQTPFDSVICATIDVFAATLYNLVLGKNYSFSWNLPLVTKQCQMVRGRKGGLKLAPEQFVSNF